MIRASLARRRLIAVASKKFTQALYPLPPVYTAVARWSSGYRPYVVLCSNPIHNHYSGGNRRLISTIAGTLRPGEDRRARLHAGRPPDVLHAAFSLVMFSENGTRTYAFEELAGRLGEAGFHEPQRVDLPPAGQGSVVTAERGA